MISAIGLVGGLALLIVLTVRGMSILVAAPLCATLVAATAGIAMLPPLAADGAPDLMTAYMGGFTSFMGDWFPMFLLGAIFGKLMEESGAADAVARQVVDRFGPGRAVLAVVIACAVLTYGGVSVFIVAFGVHPMAVGLFREADLPRRFIPGALTFGSVTFTMTSAGSPEIQNLIPMQYLGTTPLAGWQASLPVALVMAIVGHVWLGRMVRQAVAAGERFEARDGDAEPVPPHELPTFVAALSPLVVVLGVFLLTSGTIRGASLLDLGKWSLVVALGAGCLVVYALGGARGRAGAPRALSDGAIGAVIAIANTCAVVGFGAVARETSAFTAALEALQGLPGDPLIGAAIAVTVVAGLTGSASGGQSIALPLVAPIYLDMGVNPDEMHRVVAIASGALDSLPHNGYVVTTIRVICGETHASSYGAVGRLTVVVPLFGLALALAIFAVL
ncbi:MAG: GntP family permease [Sandaracinaceae bacterium]